MSMWLCLVCVCLVCSAELSKVLCPGGWWRCRRRQWESYFFHHALFAQSVSRNINWDSLSEALFFFFSYEGVWRAEGALLTHTACFWGLCPSPNARLCGSPLLPLQFLLSWVCWQRSRRLLFFLQAHIHAASTGWHIASLCFVQVYRCKTREQLLL